MCLGVRFSLACGFGCGLVSMCVTGSACPPPRSPLLEAARRQEPEMVGRLLGAKAHVNERDPLTLDTALHFANDSQVAALRE